MRRKRDDGGEEKGRNDAEADGSNTNMPMADDLKTTEKQIRRDRDDRAKGAEELVLNTTRTD